MNYELIEKNNKKIFLVDMRNEENKIFSDLTWKWINKYIKNWKKIAIIVNKKWYSSWTICNDCWYIPKCENCDVPIAYHINKDLSQFWLCHICKRHYNEISKCPECEWYNIKKYWYWTEKIQEQIKNTFWIEALIIQSEKVNSLNKSKKSKEEIEKNNIIIWTSILSRIRWIKFDLVIFLNADIWLNIPDYNSNYSNFIFIYEALNNLESNNFIIQSFSTENHSIKNACNFNIEEFKKTELEYRKNFWYPPYKQLCKILYKDEIEKKLFDKVNKLYQEILFLKEKYWLDDIEVYSTPAMIYKMFWKYRYNIIIKWNNIEWFIDIIYSKLEIQKKWFKIDMHPNNLI